MNPKDAWAEALTALSEKEFFALATKTLGRIKTPYTRQKLIECMLVLIGDPENRRALASFISKEDAWVIAAISVLEKPTLQELLDFAGFESKSPALVALISDLQARLIVYEKKGTLALNPHLHELLKPHAENIAPLFPSYPFKGTASPVPSLALELGAALAFFIEHERESVFKQDGKLWRRISEIGAKVGLKTEEIASVLEVLELININGERCLVQKQKLKAFTELSQRERIEYYAAATYVCEIANLEHSATREATRKDWFRQGQIRTIASFIHSFFDFLETDRLYPRISLQRLNLLLKKQGLGPTHDRSAALPNLDILLELLKRRGLLHEEKLEATGETLYVKAPVLNEELGSVVLESDFSLFLYPEIPFRMAIFFAQFCELKEIGAAVRFELTRESAVRGFDKGLCASTMLETLTKLLRKSAANTAIDNLATALRDWEENWHKAALYRGLVLYLDEDRRYIEKVLGELVFKTLAPGVYLLSVFDEDEAINALRAAGLSITARPPKRENPPDPLNNFVPLPTLKAPHIVHDASEQPTADASYRKKFRDVVLGLALDKAVESDLLDRVNRGLFLNETQIKKAAELAKGFRLEARLLDYRGKETLARTALKEGATLEVQHFVSDGQGQRSEIVVRGFAQAMKKTPGGYTLTINTLEGQTLSFQLSAISILRLL